MPIELYSTFSFYGTKSKRNYRKEYYVEAYGTHRGNKTELEYVPFSAQISSLCTSAKYSCVCDRLYLAVFHMQEERNHGNSSSRKSPD